MRNEFDYLKEVNKEISKWELSGEKFLNIVSLPYNPASFFEKLILKYIENGKKVLYITNEDKEAIKIITEFRKTKGYKGHCYFDKYSREECFEVPLVITNYKYAIKISRTFDLIIYDDLACYSRYQKLEIIGLLSRCVKDKNTKIIAYSYIGIFNTKNEISIPVYYDGLPIVEPRIMLTRIKSKKEIPFSVYEYLKWSMIMNRKVVIYIDTEEVLINIYQHLLSLSNELTKDVYIMRQEDRKNANIFMNKKKSILLCNKFNDKLQSDDGEVDFVAYLKDSNDFDLKKLLFLCGKGSHGKKEKRGEVIFLAYEAVSEIEEVKNITRGFNKKAWELGLLRL